MSQNIDSVLKKTGIPEDLVYSLEDRVSLARLDLPKRVLNSLEKLQPQKFVVYQNRIIALFFDEPNDDKLHTKIWNTNINPLAIFIRRPTNTIIYNGFSFTPNLSDSDKTKFEEFLDEHGKPIKIEDFSIWDYLLGNKLENIPTKNTVDFELLENLKNTKSELEKVGLNSEITNNLLGRLLFIAFLYDRELLSKKEGLKQFFDTEKKQKNREDFCNLIEDKERLYKLFETLKSELNGDLFPVSESEENMVDIKHLEILKNLFAGGNSLFEMYDFRLIPVELISEIYERLMGKKNQKENSAHYTPSFLVDYIIAKTVRPHLKNPKNDKSCKVFDPSCGSGIFLVESLRQIIEANLDGNDKMESEKLKKLAIENIFGVDLDETAVNITIFSLYLVLLDYVDKHQISKFKFPYLRGGENEKGNNIFCRGIFDTSNEFNEIIRYKNLDFILGNPPWRSDKSEEYHSIEMKKENKRHEKYIKLNSLPVSDKQLAQSFTLKTQDFSSKNTKCCLVLPSKILYNHKAEKFRNHWLNNFSINEVLELSPVRNHIFSKAKAPTSIIFFEKSNPEEAKNQITTHVSLKPNVFLIKLNVLVIEKNDEKRVKQKYFIESDWLWKVMLYGNVLDYYLIKRLREGYPILEGYIKKQKLIDGVGYKDTDNVKDPDDSSEHIGKKFASPDNIHRFYISNTKTFQQKTVGHLPRRNIFEAPLVFIKEGATTIGGDYTFDAKSVYTDEDFIYKSSTTGIKGEKKNSKILKNLVGIINSKITNYLLLLQASYLGVEREKISKGDLLKNVFVSTSQTIPKLVDEIQDIYKQEGSADMGNQDLENRVEYLENQLNQQVFKSFGIKENSLDKKLIDYALEISIPLYNFKPEKENKAIKPVTQHQLKDYAQTFYDFFSQRWNDGSTYFSVKIYWHEYVVAMSFEVSETKPKTQIEFTEIKKDKNQNIFEKIKKLIKLGEEKITDTFFKQQDIRGFNENSFYVVKPNQYKNWHPAVGEADVREFVSEMQKAAKKSLTQKKL